MAKGYFIRVWKDEKNITHRTSSASRTLCGIHYANNMFVEKKLVDHEKSYDVAITFSVDCLWCLAKLGRGHPRKKTRTHWEEQDNDREEMGD